MIPTPPKNYVPLDQLKPGDRVVLRWDGYQPVPQYCDGATATVIRVKRKRVRVGNISAYTGELDVREYHVRSKVS